MALEFSVNINDECARVIRWAEIERGYSPGTVVAAGVMLLSLIEESDEVSLVDRDGNRQVIHGFPGGKVPSDIYDF